MRPTNNYKDGASYAYKLFGPWVYRDMLHDVYMTHYKKTGENIFTDRTPTFLFQALKWRRNDYWRSTRTIGAWRANKWKNVISVPRMVAQEEFNGYDDFVQEFIAQDLKERVLEIIVRKVIMSFINSTQKNPIVVPETTLEILNYLLKGYKVKEIAEETKKSAQVVDYHVKKIRTLWTYATKLENSYMKPT